ncbi:hypothetical protein CL629_02450 [bacterium]|nr:hypothetical protein [bacterium]|tara:strand:+ start:231 stop:722 length:492 start_codon:yes stop_codon:yes gene_type:complete
MEAKILIYAVNIIAIALPIALFEICIEKGTGWGAGFSKDKWYGKIIGKNNRWAEFLTRTIGIPHFTTYHICMLFLFLPILLAVEYFFFLHNILLIVAIYIGVLIIEDFLWFVLNWHFPALKELLKGPHGKIWWHKQWIKIFNKFYLPKSYLAIIISILLLLTA